MDFYLLGASFLVILGVLVSKASARLGVPALLLFLGIGLMAGSEGIGGVHFDNAEWAQRLGVVALAYILFSGGMDTRWSAIRPVLWQGFALSTVGVLVTASVTGVVAKAILPLSWVECLLLGAIVSSTDAAAVFSVLRGRGTGLQKDLGPLLELESGSNDPMAVLLTIGLTQMIVNPDLNPWMLIPFFFQQVVLGAVFGYLLGRGLVWLINRLDLEYEGLYPVLTLSSVMAIYSLSSVFKGNGFLSVYVAGLVAGNSVYLHKQSLVRFHDGLAWLMQIGMFLTLGLLAFPSHVLSAVGAGSVVALGLIFLARPLGVFLALAPFKRGPREKFLVSWVGLRGSVPIVLATFPLLAGVASAESMFNVVFFIVVFSVAVQGTTLTPLARALGLAAASTERRAPSMEFHPAISTDTGVEEVRVWEGSEVVGKTVVELGLPPGVLLVLVSRADGYSIPKGNTVIRAGDVLTVAGGASELATLRRRFTDAVS